MAEAAADSAGQAAAPGAGVRVRLPQTDAARFALTVVEALRAAGHDAFLVGGCARDLALGLAPKDFDVATSARPEQVVALFVRVVEVGVSFGVVRVLGPGAAPVAIEVATFRADLAYEDGRRPTGVRFVGVEQDVLRRDFTMNGLLLDPAPGAAVGAEVAVVDLVGGLADLRAGRLRAIGVARERFEEDALRLLRGVRFAARFGLTIEADTAEAMRALAPRLRAISRERIRAELEGMLTPRAAVTALQLLADHDLAPIVWPAVARVDPGFLRARARIERLIAEAELAVAPAACDAAASVDAFIPSRGLPLPLALAALAHGAEPVAAVAHALRLSKQEARALAAIQELTDGLIAALRGPAAAFVEAPPPTLVRLLRADEGDDALRLVHALVPELPQLPATARATLTHLRRLRAATPRSRWWPTPYVDGARLRAAGCAPGPGFRAALDAALDAQLAGADAAACLAIALSATQPPTSAPAP